MKSVRGTDSTLRLLTGVLFAGALVTFALACSGSRGPELDGTRALTCGAGTVLREGECVATGADGGTIVDATVDGMVNDASNEGDADTRADVLDAHAAWTDDPCPNQGTLLADCSNSCGMATHACSEISCRGRSTAIDTMLVNIDGESGALIRTPSHPVQDPQCTLSCALSSGTNRTTPRYAVAFNLTSSSPGPNGFAYFNVRVGEPWQIENVDWISSPTFCPFPTPNGRSARGCLTFAANTIGVNVIVWTDDPTAPARNITIEPSAGPNSCH